MQQDASFFFDLSGRFLKKGLHSTKEEGRGMAR